MCWCDIVSKAKIGSLKHLGNGMEGSLRFLAEIIVGLSILRVFVNWNRRVRPRGRGSARRLASAGA